MNRFADQTIKYRVASAAFLADKLYLHMVIKTRVYWYSVTNTKHNCVYVHTLPFSESVRPQNEQFSRVSAAIETIVPDRSTDTRLGGRVLLA
jgi:hypothetical protein